MPRPNERARKPFAQPDLSPAADEDSPPFSRFLINDEGGKALDGISEDLLSAEDKVYLLDLSLLGYQVGRQEHNISDAQARRTLFQIIEKIGTVRAIGFFAEFISDQASEQDRKLIGGLLTAASDLKDQRILGNLSAATKQAADEVAGRVGEKEAAKPESTPNLALSLTTAQVAMLVDDTRLSRLLSRYEKRVREIDLPPDGFKNKEQAAAAARLAATYRELRKAQIELGCKVTPKSPRVTEADRLRVAFDRSRLKAQGCTGLRGSSHKPPRP